MIFEAVPVGSMQANCYILACAPGREAIIIDPGGQARKIQAVLDKHKLRCALVINTHGHYDHIGCDDYFNAPVYVHSRDYAMLRDPELNFSAVFSSASSVKSEIRVLEDKDAIELDCLELEVIHVPGHTQGGIALLMKKPEKGILFTGDTLFFQGIGRCDLPGGSHQALVDSISQKLLVLPENVKIYPGHGRPSTIGQEKGNH